MEFRIINCYFKFLVAALSVSLVYVVEQMGSVLQLGMTLSSATSGPLMAIFIIGFFLPWIRPRGVLIGANVGMAVGQYLISSNILTNLQNAFF